MNNDLSAQKRIYLATILAVIFFVFYDYFYLSKFKNQLDINKTMQANATMQMQNSKLNSDKASLVNNATKYDNIVEINAEKFSAKIDSLGRISSFVSNENKYKDEQGKQLDLIKNSASLKPLEIRFADANLNNKAFSTNYTASTNKLDISNSSQSVVLTQNLGDEIVTKKIKFNPDGSYNLEVSLSKDSKYFISPGSRPNVIADSYTIHGVVIKKEDGSTKVFEDGKVDENENFAKVGMGAASDRYYTTLFSNFNTGMNSVISNDSATNQSQFFAMSDNKFSAVGFIGPKDHNLLKSINPQLTDVVEYGFFTFLSKPMFSFLNWLHNFTGNWGWAIVLMTIFIRILLFYPTYKGMMSMNKLKDLAPKIKDLQEKYKNDPQKMQMHMMELYRKHGANPMSGCLPILIQIPIFFAMYRVLLNAIELKGAPWILWIHDLAIKDPYFILPIAMGILMFLQQKITPTTITDPTQEKIMKYLPLVFTLFFFTFPAGLTLYWTVNNTASLLQQFIINKIFKKEKEMAIAEKHHEN